MVILLTGASGFIGRHLVWRLSAAGHELICVSRRPPPAVPGATHLPLDFSREINAADWVSRLGGVEAVINAAGIFREEGRQTFDAVHEHAPMALFEACTRAGVRRIVQISALGADQDAQSRFHRSKQRCDSRLLAQRPDAAVVMPSLVHGGGGGSAELLNTLASLPVIPLPGVGRQAVQPIHIKDLTDVVVALLCEHRDRGGRITAVGPQALAMKDYLLELRQGLGLPGAPTFAVPGALMKSLARAGDHFTWLPLHSEAWDMLNRGNTAPVADTVEFLGYTPCPPRDFIAPSAAAAARLKAQCSWLLPIVRLSIALLWIVTGLVSLWGYPREGSLALLERTGLTGAQAQIALHGAAWLDIGLGIATLLWRHRLIWLAQIVLILCYTAIISVCLPEYWLHPYGPILKNIPLLAILWLLHEVDRRQWNT